MTKISIDNIKSSYMDKKTVEIYGEYSEKYGLWNSERQIFHEFLENDDFILDIGCGAGRTTIGLMEMGYNNIIGLDISDNMVEKAKDIAKNKNFCIEFIVGNAMNLNFNDETFDKVIFSYNGLMTIPKKENREIVIKEINRVLKTNGIFIFTTHDRESKSFSEFWKEEEMKWKEGKQNLKLYDFGDVIFGDDVKNGDFIHIPKNQEVLDMIEKGGFELLFSKTRSEIAEVSEYEKNNFGECKFYVVRKK